MDQGLKERLLGAAVLVAIAVWLIPWVLDGPEGDREPATSSLQLPAAEEPMPMRTQTLRLDGPPESSDEPTPAAATPPPAVAVGREPARSEAEPAAQESIVAAGPAPEPSIAATRTEPERATAPAVSAAAPPKPSAAAANAPAAVGDWAVQLGSFSDETNARRQAQRAGALGYKAEVSSYRSEGRTLYRVRVGPQPTRGAADAAASALRAHGLDARVVAAR